MSTNNLNYKTVYTSKRIEVINASPLTAMGTLATLQCENGELAEESILEDPATGLKWEVVNKPFCSIPPGAATAHKGAYAPEPSRQEKEEEKKGIMQYFIRPLNHCEKLVKGTKLKIVYNVTNMLGLQ